MKVARILALAAVATLAVTSMSFAAGTVWFEAAPGTPNASVIGQGGPGGTAELGCDISAGLRCDWVVTIMYQNFDGGAFGSSIDLGTLATADEGKFNIKNIQLASNALQSILNPVQINLGGGWLIDNAGGLNVTATGAPAGLYEIATFVLSKNKLPGELQTSTLHSRVGQGEFGGNDDPSGFHEVVAIGPNAAAPGYGNFTGWPAYALQGPVIVVRNTPEPATLGLIGLGVLALARRRK
ncbi:MAG: PEP-CTERM sorting domain-containing protein [Planctomycetia bacterium]|nr:PEP-CTERM sorting domain-containing protein [Planctomycetia bacterium]